MYDRFNRKINYLRISVTDRCNLRCVYCMPEEGVQLLQHKDILSFDEITELTQVAVRKGIDKVRITGGEPLVRKGIVDLIKMISEIDGIKDIGMTTNGILLDKYADDLAKAGLHRVNISLDTMDPERYRKIINCVIKESSQEPDAVAVAEFCNKNDLQVRFIKEMDLETGSFSIVQGGSGGDCAHCNRIRLTANGMIKPCLFSDLAYSVRELGAEKAIEMAVENKPASGHENHTGKFYNIGG